MVDSNQHCLGIFIIFTLGVFIVIIFIMRFFINYPQEKNIILRGVIDDLDEILSELPGDEGVRIIILLPHGRLAGFHPYPITYFFSLNITWDNGIYYTIIIILEMYSPLLLQEIGFALLIIFLGGVGLSMFLSLGI